MALEVWWSSLTAAGRELLAVLDASERARVASLEHPADQGRSLLGAALLRVAVAAHLDIRPEEVQVDRTCTECGGPHGAPRITGPGSSRPWVSVSHSGLLVVVAVNSSGPVGVDVQRVSDLADPGAGPDWVRREALLKARTFAPDTDLTVRELPVPLSGYVAALATPAAASAAYVVRHWPREATGPMIPTGSTGPFDNTAGVNPG